MKIGILGFDQKEGKFNIGSSRIRVDWLIKYWPEAERFTYGQQYDVVIFQKAYFIEYAKEFKGIKILDMCDPDWLEQRSRVVEMIQEVDAVTTSSFKLAEYITNLTDKPVWFIPDRMDMEFHKQKKVHFGRAKTAVWFGYSHNQELLNSAVKSLVDLKMDLVVVSNKPYHPPRAYIDKIDITNYSWELETANDNIIRGDVVINPYLEAGRYKYKSNNKTLTSWALGMPVAQNDADLKRFLSEDERKKEAELRLKEVELNYDVKISVEEYKKLIDELCLKANSTAPVNTMPEKQNTAA